MEGDPSEDRKGHSSLLNHTGVTPVWSWFYPSCPRLYAGLSGIEEGSSYEVTTVRFLQQYVVPSRIVTSVGIPTSHSSFYVLRIRRYDTTLPTWQVATLALSSLDSLKRNGARLTFRPWYPAVWLELLGSCHHSAAVWDGAVFERFMERHFCECQFTGGLNPSVISWYRSSSTC